MFLRFPNNPAFTVAVANVVFEPGCRNNWHSYSGGQILICIDGEAGKGKPNRDCSNYARRKGEGELTTQNPPIAL